MRPIGNWPSSGFDFLIMKEGSEDNAIRISANGDNLWFILIAWHLSERQLTVVFLPSAYLLQRTNRSLPLIMNISFGPIKWFWHGAFKYTIRLPVLITKVDSDSVATSVNWNSNDNESCCSDFVDSNEFVFPQLSHRWWRFWNDISIQSVTTI